MRCGLFAVQSQWVATGDSQDYETNPCDGTNCFVFCSSNSRGGLGAKSRAIKCPDSSGRDRLRVLPNELASSPVHERRRKSVFYETEWPRKDRRTNYETNPDPIPATTFSGTSMRKGRRALQPSRIWRTQRSCHPEGSEFNSERRKYVQHKYQARQ